MPTQAYTYVFAATSDRTPQRQRAVLPVNLILEHHYVGIVTKNLSLRQENKLIGDLGRLSLAESLAGHLFPRLR